MIDTIHQTETLIVAVATFATAVVLMLMVCSVILDRQKGRADVELEAAQAMYEGQFSAVWQEGYSAGVYDQSVAADYTAGAPYEQYGPARVNPYAPKAEAAR